MSNPIPGSAVKLRSATPASSATTVQTLTRSERLARKITRPHVAFPAVILSVALLAWSGIAVFAPGNLPVYARHRVTPTTNATLTAKGLAELETQARAAAQHLFDDREAVVRILSRLEQQAHALGFQVEVSRKTAIPNAAGFKELIIHPVVFTLENDSDRDGPAFQRLLSWLSQTSQLERKIDVAALNLQSKDNGLTRAQVELHFWTNHDHDKPAAK